MAAGDSNGAGWSDGDYQQLAAELLADIYSADGDPNALAAYNWLMASGAPYLDLAASQGSTSSPGEQFNITPTLSPGAGGGSSGGGSSGGGSSGGGSSGGGSSGGGSSGGGSSGGGPVLSVGSGQQYATIAQAVAAAHSGDTIEVKAGTYTNDFPKLIAQNLTLEAVGGVVHMLATKPPPNGKGILDVGAPGVSVTISGFDFSGAAVPDGNGAGIRYEGGTLTLSGNSFEHNQDGLLAAADANGVISINHSTFTANGAGDGHTHNLYVNQIGTLSVANSRLTAAVVGHDIKSRANNTIVQNNTIADGPSGNSSYEIDLPNGGNAVITGNLLEKGPHASNPNFISDGEEGGIYSNTSLTVSNNTILNDNPSSSVVAVQMRQPLPPRSPGIPSGISRLRRCCMVPALSPIQPLSPRNLPGGGRLRLPP